MSRLSKRILLCLAGILAGVRDDSMPTPCMARKAQVQMTTPAQATVMQPVVQAQVVQAAVVTGPTNLREQRLAIDSDAPDEGAGECKANYANCLNAARKPYKGVLAVYAMVGVSMLAYRLLVHNGIIEAGDDDDPLPGWAFALVLFLSVVWDGGLALKNGFQELVFPRDCATAMGTGRGGGGGGGGGCE